MMDSQDGLLANDIPTCHKNLALNLSTPRDAFSLMLWRAKVISKLVISASRLKAWDGDTNLPIGMSSSKNERVFL